MTRPRSPDLHAAQNYYLLISGAGANQFGKVVSALDVVESRLASELWPIYEHTRNRKVLKAGDICVVYLAGTAPFGQTITHQFTVEEIVVPGRRRLPIDQGLASTAQLTIALKISSLLTFRPPRSVRPKLNALSFVGPNKMRWGMAFHGGCRRLSEADYRLLIATE